MASESARERLLQATAERLRRAQKAGRLGTWDWDVRSNELIWDGVEAVHGLPEGAFDGTLEGYTRDMHPDDKQRVLAAITQAAATGADLDIDYRIVAPDGGIRWVSGRGTCFLDEAGATVRMSGTCQDITDRKRADEDKDALLSFAAHELRSPLTSILGFARILERNAASKPGAQDDISLEAAQTIVSESQRMAEIIEYFLDLGRAESRQIEMQIADFDLMQLLREEIERVSVKAPAIEIDAGLPDAPLIIRSDVHRLRQAFSNLLDNAVKYGGAPPQIVVRCDVASDRVVARIRDNGAGIAVEDRPRLFQRFYRGHTGAGKGLGIGLYLSRRFIEQLGGSLELTSPPGERTEFSLTLPLSS